MATYNVTIDDNTMINILMDRVDFWVKDSDPSYSLYEGLITDLVENGLFEGSSFDPCLIVDNLYINDTSLYDSVEEAVKDGYEESDIAYLDEESGCVLVWA